MLCLLEIMIWEQSSAFEDCFKVSTKIPSPLLNSLSSGFLTFHMMNYHHVAKSWTEEPLRGPLCWKLGVRKVWCWLLYVRLLGMWEIHSSFSWGPEHVFSVSVCKEFTSRGGSNDGKEASWHCSYLIYDCLWRLTRFVVCLLMMWSDSGSVACQEPNSVVGCWKQYKQCFQKHSLLLASMFWIWS